ncbi:MAG: hypothetical protein KDA79_09500, partial [Planctomycetaceae bacterium]|nr:hypothetical protein [Planctomycetaceae bacterium]
MPGRQHREVRQRKKLLEPPDHHRQKGKLNPQNRHFPHAPPPEQTMCRVHLLTGNRLSLVPCLWKEPPMSGFRSIPRRGLFYVALLLTAA